MSFFVVIRGPLGAGKTTISKRLSVVLHGKYVSIDRILDEEGLEEWEDGYVSLRSFMKANRFAAAEALASLKSGIRVIFDGNFYYRNQIEDLIIRLRGYSGFVFTLKVPLELCIRRDANRERPFGMESAVEVFSKATEFDYGIDIEASGTVNETIGLILNRLPVPPDRGGETTGSTAS